MIELGKSFFQEYPSRQGRGKPAIGHKPAQPRDGTQSDGLQKARQDHGAPTLSLITIAIEPYKMPV